MPKTDRSPEEQSRYNDMLNAAVTAKNELRLALRDDPNLSAIYLINWVKRHYLNASYTHLCKAMIALAEELKL